MATCRLLGGSKPQLKPTAGEDQEEQNTSMAALQHTYVGDRVRQVAAEKSTTEFGTTALVQLYLGLIVHI
jgi:hypothetical protein